MCLAPTYADIGRHGSDGVANAAKTVKVQAEQGLTEFLLWSLLLVLLGGAGRSFGQFAALWRIMVRMHVVCLTVQLTRARFQILPTLAYT